MKYYKLFLFLLLTIMDVSTNAQEVTCEGEQLLNVDVLMGHPGIVSPYKPGHILVFRCTDVNMKMYGQRTIECLSNGKWDNPYPKCGAVKCPAIRTNAFVNASGNTEEGSYGDVIHFECVSADKKIDGSSDIHCTETGEWSDSVPTCKEITCTAPVISNGFVVERVQEYQKDAILKYRCSPGFKAREGIPKCAKFGWTLNPECDDVTCELKSTRFGVQKINPGGKTIFRAGESVEITCTEKYWIFGTKEFIKSFTCQENGEWDHPPVCQGKCGPPPHVNFADTTEMTKREYNSGERVEYSCFNKYILDQRHPYSKYLTCEDGEWRGNIKCLKPCSVSLELMDERGVELRWGGRQKIFSPNGDKITFICQRGKSSIGIDLKQTYSNKTALVRGGHSRSQRVKVLPYFYLIH